MWCINILLYRHNSLKLPVTASTLICLNFLQQLFTISSYKECMSVRIEFVEYL